MNIIQVFTCPFHEECHEERFVEYLNNEPYEIIIPIKCKAPFLMWRKTGETICRINIESDKKDNWIESIKDIGRRKEVKNDHKVK